jgi:hypothetical protein
MSIIPYIKENTAWYFLSIFYARNNWVELLSQIKFFYEDRKDKFTNVLILLSEERGEHINVAFSSSIANISYQKEIEDYFNTFVANHSSILENSFPYGKTVWGHYLNNTLVWNIFRLESYTSQVINFYQKTFHLSRILLDSDFSADNTFNVGLYLFTKGITCLEPQQQTTLHQLFCEFENYNKFIDLINEIIDNQIQLEEVCETIESYWIEQESAVSLELKDWLDEEKTLMKLYGYKQLSYIICGILGLNELHQVMLLELLNRWYSTKQDVIQK